MFLLTCSTVTAIQERDAGNSSDVVNDQCNGGSQRPPSIRLLINRMAVEYHRVPPTPEYVQNPGEAISTEPVEEEQHGVNEREGWAAPEEREEGDGWEMC